MLKKDILWSVAQAVESVSRQGSILNPYEDFVISLRSTLRLTGGRDKDAVALLQLLQQLDSLRGGVPHGKAS